jgi:hypothetical protein
VRRGLRRGRFRDCGRLDGDDVSGSEWGVAGRLYRDCGGAGREAMDDVHNGGLRPYETRCTARPTAAVEGQGCRRHRARGSTAKQRNEAILRCAAGSVPFPVAAPSLRSYRRPVRNSLLHLANGPLSGHPFAKCSSGSRRRRLERDICDGSALRGRSRVDGHLQLSLRERRRVTEALQC